VNLARAIGCYLASQFFAVVDGAMAHHLGPRGLSVGQIAFANALGLLVLVVILSGRSTRKVFRTSHPWKQIARALLSCVAMWLMIYALTHLQFADASAINRTRPLWMILLGAILLSEAVTAQRWLATVVGILGAIVTLGPAFNQWNPAYIAAVVGVLLSSGNMIANSYVGRFDSTATTMAYSSAVILLLSLPAAFDVFPWALWPGIVVLASANALSLWLLQVAVRKADVSLLAPYDNVRLPIAILIGILAFAEIPSWSTFVGSALIVAAGTLLYLREKRSQTSLGPQSA
jgi:drug/metabolite transporter (DMT)-like permease